MGLFQPDVHNKATINELHRPLWSLENKEGSWREVIKNNKQEYQNSLFPEMQGACF